MATERKRRVRETDKKGNAGFRVLAVQCAACAALVLVLWLFARFGGNAAAQLREYLKTRLEDNSFTTAVSLWAQNLVSESDEESKEDSKPNAAFVSVLPMHLSNVASSSTTVLPIAVEHGTITSCFGSRENPTAAGDEFHKGLDIAANAGTPISAMRFGVVTKVGEDAWLGNYVVLSHGDVDVTYAHCQTVTVQKGDVVKAGDAVATVGSTGNSTGNHLHIEVYRDGELCDPAEMVTVSAYD